MRLKIELPTSWQPHENPEGPTTFVRDGSMNAFQISWAEYRGQKPLPEVTAEGLERMAVNFGQKNNFGSLSESSGGSCRFGSFGTSVFRSDEYPRVQLWFISDGGNYIMATYFCQNEPQESEIAEAKQIASSLALGPD